MPRKQAIQVSIMILVIVIAAWAGVVTQLMATVMDQGSLAPGAPDLWRGSVV